MPNINRIRVNNVKYNFGTQCYDDFTMRLYGKNTLYDLANGGGKSVLMLLLLQNLIPNCTLDEKQPIEKLFRTGGGNTVIHSLVEWKLEDSDSGYRYMTTGFCARKSKDSSDQIIEDKDTAAIEYFNYCILYRNYNGNDIINLPLSKKDEKISFSGLKNYLKELGRKDLSMEVQVFDRKGEYQRFISQYGIYESQWEIIRGINKTEGHVRTYFETNYKTTRKVVEDLLVEEIIEKAFYVKTERDNSGDDMAKTLLEIKDKLVELSNKKRDIKGYDRQIELIHVLEARVTAFLNLYEERDRLTKKLADIYVTGDKFTSENSARLDSLTKAKEDKEQEKNEQRRRLESLKIKSDTYELEEQKLALDGLNLTLSKNNQEIQLLKEELNLKESINDYLAYLEDKKQVEENEAIIKAELNKGDDQSRRMRQLASLKHERDQEKLEKIQPELKKAQEKLLATIKEMEISLALVKEGEVALEIAKSHEKSAKEELGLLMEDISKLRSNTNILMLSDVEELVKTNEENLEYNKNEMERLQEEVKKETNNHGELVYLCRELDRQKKVMEDDLFTVTQKIDEYRANANKLNQMLKIYGAKEKKELLSAINERYISYVVDLANKKKELSTMNNHLTRLVDKQVVGVPQSVQKVKDYIESRHGISVMLGVDYISGIQDDNKRDLLSRYPLLPYGVIVPKLKDISMDTQLNKIDTGDFAVPIFNQGIIDIPMSREDREEQVIYVCKGEEEFTNSEYILKEQEKCLEKIDELKYKIDRLEDLGGTYKADMEYVARLTENDFINAEDMAVNLKVRISEVTKDAEQKNAQRISSMGKIQEDSDKLEKLKNHFYELLEDNKNLESIKTISKRVAVVENSAKEYNKEALRLEIIVEKNKSEVDKWTILRSELSTQVKALQETEEQLLSQWQEIYQEYYYPETIISQVPYNMEDGQLEAEFKALLAVSNSITVVLKDKKKLIETLRISMNRGVKSILRRDISLETLEKLDKKGQLYFVEEEILNTLSRQLSEAGTKEAQLRNELHLKNSIFDKLSGSIEKSIKVLEERYGFYEELNVTLEEAKGAINEGDRLIRTLEEEYGNIEAEYKEYLAENITMIELFKDVKRIVATNDIDVSLGMILYEDKDSLREIFETRLMDFDKSKKALDKARIELLNYKNHTAETLNQLHCYELAGAIANDVSIPEDYGNARELLNNLGDIISFINLEKGRVEKGIEDMEYIKTNFESQCIERCRDVKTELDKLPKLSRIILEGEQIQMVGLTIPYVKEEFYQQRMSDYIDDVVNGADKYEDNQERMKYIRSRLVLKKLFGVIVTDMNSIKLSLYKRERIKEQSRYLKYEEAVGSTGQSQGIYIQFLVSIINYIAGMYSPSGDSDKLKKVIFIDNPFGAAKDVYIWEPIFALLKTNQVQLVVPARGATPAITSRFDVNYILGQRLVGSKQQTVVMDYRSQVEQEELEYHSLDYDQVSFDFI